MKIEHNVVRENYQTGMTDALRALEVGDSFVCPLKQARTSAAPMAIRMGIRVSVRKISDGQARVWRVA